eukprot:s4486_g9.t1
MVLHLEKEMQQLEKLVRHISGIKDFLQTKTPGRAASSSNVDVVTDQTASERLPRYMNSEFCEVSDPDDWHVLYYSLGSPASDEDSENADGADGS